jgi:hypothetical protein
MARDSKRRASPSGTSPPRIARTRCATGAPSPCQCLLRAVVPVFQLVVIRRISLSAFIEWCVSGSCLRARADAAALSRAPHPPNPPLLY